MSYIYRVFWEVRYKLPKHLVKEFDYLTKCIESAGDRREGDKLDSYSKELEETFGKYQDDNLSIPSKLKTFILATKPKDWTPKITYLGTNNSRGYAINLIQDENVWIEFDIRDNCICSEFEVMQYKQKYSGPNFGIQFAHDGIAFNPRELNHNPRVIYSRTADIDAKFKEIDIYYTELKKSKIQEIEDDFKNMLEERFG